MSFSRNEHEEIHARRYGFSVPHWVHDADLSLLTERELQVLAALGDCQSNSVIADRLFITERTVKKHVASVFSKLEITSRTEAAVIAILGSLALGQGVLSDTGTTVVGMTPSDGSRSPRRE
jgi:DNA-binding NarL/FixJ family response regulator